MSEMLSSILKSGSDTAGLPGVQQLVLCVLTSLGLGIFVAYVHMYRNTYTKSFVVTLAILPVLVQSVIMLVGGNMGTGMAVLGAFSLIRFRSVAGGAREISSIFWAMGIGLATGTGYLLYTVAFSIVIAIFLIVLNTVPFGQQQKTAQRHLRIMIAEDIDYPNLFDDIFAHFTYQAELEQVRTTNMGSLYELSYDVLLKDVKQEKQMIDALRTRNGNLSIISGKATLSKQL